METNDLISIVKNKNYSYNQNNLIIENLTQEQINFLINYLQNNKTIYSIFGKKYEFLNVFIDCNKLELKDIFNYTFQTLNLANRKEFNTKNELFYFKQTLEIKKCYIQFIFYNINLNKNEVKLLKEFMNFKTEIFSTLILLKEKQYLENESLDIQKSYKKICVNPII